MCNSKPRLLRLPQNCNTVIAELQRHRHGQQPYVGHEPASLQFTLRSKEGCTAGLPEKALLTANGQSYHCRQKTSLQKSAVGSPAHLTSNTVLIPCPATLIGVDISSLIQTILTQGCTYMLIAKTGQNRTSHSKLLRAVKPDPRGARHMLDE